MVDIILHFFEKSEIFLGMGRKRTCLTLRAMEGAELRRRWRRSRDAREQERLKFLLLAQTGDYTLEELAAELGRARATLQLWLAKYRAGGVAELLKRETSPGVGSPLRAAAVQAELRAGWASGQWRTAEEVAVWLKQAHGIRRARKSIYYWLRRLGVGGKSPDAGAFKQRPAP